MKALLVVVLFGTLTGCAVRSSWEIAAKAAKLHSDEQNRAEQKQTYGGSKVMQLTEGNFQGNVLDSDVVVLVDFYADWCGPCRMLAPVLEEVEKESRGKYKIGKVNIDESQEIAAKYQVSAIPKMVIFKNGKVVHQMIGLQTKAQIKAALKEAVDEKDVVEDKNE